MRLYCYTCGKPVSTEVPDDTVFRAVAECPECCEKGEPGATRDERSRIRGELLASLEYLRRAVRPEDNRWTNGVLDALNAVKASLDRICPEMAHASDSNPDRANAGLPLAGE